MALANPRNIKRVLETESPMQFGRDMEVMKQIIRELADLQRWRSVADEQPDDGARVLAYNARCDQVGCITWNASKRQFEDWRRLQVLDVTHWMPLPKGPES